MAGLTTPRGDPAEANFAVQFHRRELISRRHKRVRHFYYASRYSNLEFPQLAATNADAPKRIRVRPAIASSRFTKIKIGPTGAHSRTRVYSLGRRRDPAAAWSTNGRRKRDLMTIHNAFYTVPYRESSPRTPPVISMPRRRVISCNKAEEAALRCESRACRCVPSRAERGSPFVRRGRSAVSCRELAAILHSAVGVDES